MNFIAFLFGFLGVLMAYIMGFWVGWFAHKNKDELRKNNSIWGSN